MNSLLDATAVPAAELAAELAAQHRAKLLEDRTEARDEKLRAEQAPLAAEEAARQPLNPEVAWFF